MGILSGNPQNEPMHCGEVFSTWSYLFAKKGLVAGYQTMLNHAGDEDLQKLLGEAIEMAQQESKDIEVLLKENGISLPPAPPERAKACVEDIPPGARIQDPEIAAMLSKDIAAGLVACSQAMGIATREDIAMMFGQFHIQATALGGKVLRLNKNKGWLVSPPLHYNKADHC